VDDVGQGEVGDEALYLGSVGAFAYQDVARVGESLDGSGRWRGGRYVGTFVVGEAADPADEEPPGERGGGGKGWRW
jgi:hypothetical protein